MVLPSDSFVKTLEISEVPAGSTAVLNCTSNDYNHNFMFWLLNNKSQVIGPGNDYDEKKYKYEVLSGKLRIDVSTEELILLCNIMVLQAS